MKKFFNLLMVLVVLFSFVACDNGSTSTEPPAPVNNFKGKTFIGMTGEGEDAYFASYIIFTSDEDCEVMFFDEDPMPATYTVADDVATLKGTGEYAALQLSTTKLTDGKFSITIPPAVSKEEEDIVVSYAVGTLWTILYDIPESDEDFSLKMPEEELESAVDHFGFVEADYNKDDATKTVTLTASGWAKVQAAMGGDSDDEGGNTETPETPVVTNNFKGNVFVAEWSVESYSGYWGYIEFIDDTNGKMGISNYDEAGDPIITEQPFTYSVTDDVATLEATMEGEEFTVTTSGLIDNSFTFSTEDVDEESGEKISILMTCTKGDKSLFDVWTVYYDEQELMNDFLYEIEVYATENGLNSGDDYTKDDETKTITLTVSGWEKVQAAMGGGSEDDEEGSGEVTGETWTVLDPEGNTLETFESLEAAGAFATENGLDSDVDYTMDPENQTITLTEAGWVKVSGV